MTSKRSVDPATRARELLAKLNIRTLPVPVDRIAKTLGAQLRYSPLDEELSGMIFIKGGTPIIGVNALHHPNRQRFTIAHEIGHLELHRDVISSAVHVDKQFPILMRDANSAIGTEKMEIEANRFAAELLMPLALIDQILAGRPFDIDDESPLDDLAKKLRVSKQALEYRIRNLPPRGR
ncbi:MAG: ImmA/IrrE family metallo-endopeptidase [Methylocella sp.]